MDGKQLFSAQAELFSDTFKGFGPSRFRPANEIAAVHELCGKGPNSLKHGVKQHAPKLPGVYGMLDSHNRLIYVGKAKILRSRLLSYFRKSSRNPKAEKIIRQTRRLLWEQTGDEFAALLRELELIQRFRPPYNVLGVPGLQRHHYLCLGRSPAPYVYVAARPTGKELGVYGPFVRWTNSENAARRLNDLFQLRDCPQTVSLHFAGQGKLFNTDRVAKCLRFELATCAGPCIGGCTRHDYAARVRAVKAFLDGRDRTILTTLRQQMVAAAQAFQFEQAQSLRDKLQALEWVDKRLVFLRRARDQSAFVYPLVGADGRTRWYLLQRGQVQAVTFAPTAETKNAVKVLLATTFTGISSQGMVSDDAVDSVLLVTGWLRKVAGIKQLLLTPKQAERACTRAGTHRSDAVRRRN